jgi:hypothetical protein
MTTIYIGIGVFLVLGLVLLAKGLHRLWRRKLMRGSLQGLAGLLFISLAALAISVAMNLYTYQVFNQEELVAEVRFEEIGPQYYRIYFSPAGEAARLFEMRGDEWQIDTRILKWNGLANILGMQTVYRLDRLSGRYRSVEQERDSLRTVHDLSSSKGLDLWAWSREHQHSVPWIDAIYGSAAYMPMANRAQYTVTVSHSGLIIRPANSIAQQAVESWN